MLKDKVINGIDITDTYNINYESTDGVNVYSSHNAPSERGTYYVTVELINNNYAATNTVLYKVERGVIESIEFDQYTLEKQKYKSVIDPIITTSPSNISYYIVYQGHNTTRPKDAAKAIIWTTTDAAAPDDISYAPFYNSRTASVMWKDVSISFIER